MSSYLLLFSLSSLNICWGLLTSIQAPLFPNEALSKGASASQFSPVFGIIHAALCFASPFLGTWIRVIGIGRAFKLGVALPTITCILFGFLTFVPPESTTVFLVLAYLLRLLEGVGGAAVWTTMLTLLLARFPNSSSRVYALQEATFGVGVMSGPVLGSFLFKAGGFLLPFVVCGVSLAVTGVLSVFSIREVVTLAEKKEDENKLSIKELLHIPGVIAGLLTATISGYSIFYIDSLLEPFLSQFNLSITVVGLSFLAMSVPYTLASLVMGWLTDRYFTPWMVCICGLLITIIGFILVGPSPYLPLSSSLPLTLVALVLLGFGTSTALVASYSSALASALEAGYAETMDTYSIVSGVWTSAFSLGNFMGPTAGGFLYDQVGFSWGTVVIQVVAVLGIAFNSCIRLWPEKSQDSSDGLNRPSIVEMTNSV